MSASSIALENREWNAGSASARSSPAWFSLFGSLDSVLENLPDTWQAATTVADRRDLQRFRCDVQAWLKGLDKTSIQGAPAIEVRVKDISRTGIGLAHRQPLAHRLVIVRMAPDGAPSTDLVVRLHWCRFRGPNAYESGGQIQWFASPPRES